MPRICAGPALTNTSATIAPRQDSHLPLGFCAEQYVRQSPDNRGSRTACRRSPPSSPSILGEPRPMAQQAPTQNPAPPRNRVVPTNPAHRRQASPPTLPSLRGGVADAAIQFHRPTDAIVDSKTADRKNAGVKRQLRSAASLSSPANLGPL